MALDSEPASVTTPSTKQWLRRDRPLLVYGLMLLVAVSLVLNRFIPVSSLPDEAMTALREYRNRRQPLQLETAETVELERYFALEGVPSAVPNPDSARYTLKGGSVRRMINRKACWSAFVGRGNQVLLALAFPGGLGELPPAAEIRQIGEFRFHVYGCQEMTVVLCQQATRGFALVSDSDGEDLIRLAQVIAKT